MVLKRQPGQRKTGPSDLELEAALRPAQKRLGRQRLLTWLANGLLVALILCISLLTVARLWPWETGGFWCLATLLFSMLAAGLMAWLTRPGCYQAALYLDQHGLKERAVTALEMAGTHSRIALRQKQDALNFIRNFNETLQIKLLPSRKTTAMIAVMTGLALLLVILPNPQQQVIRQQREVRQAAREQAKKIEQVRRQLEKSPSKDSAQQRENAAVLKELENELERSRTLKQSLQALARAEDTLLRLRQSAATNDPSPQDIQKLVNALQGQAGTRALGERIKAGDQPGSQAALNELIRQAARDNEQQREQMAAGLEQAIPTMTGDTSQGTAKGLAGGIRNASSTPALSAQIGDIAGLAGVYTGIDNSIAAALSSRQALLAAASGPGAAASTGGGAAVEAVAGADSPGASAGGSTAAGNGSGSGSSGGQGNGTGGGQQGQGSGGGGAGLGSGSGSEAIGPPAGTGGAASGSAPLSPRYGEYEKIFDPDTIGSAGESSHVQGQAGQGPEQSLETGQALTLPGQLLPYRQVLGQYSQRSQDALDRSSVPPGMKEIVKDYFASLAE